MFGVDSDGQDMPCIEHFAIRCRDVERLYLVFCRSLLPGSTYSIRIKQTCKTPLFRSIEILPPCCMYLVGIESTDLNYSLLIRWLMAKRYSLSLQSFVQ